MISIPGTVKEVHIGTNAVLALNRLGEVYQWGLLLLWDNDQEVRSYN